MPGSTREYSVAIVDYGTGNLFSIKNACDYVGLNGFLTSSSDEIAGSDAVILPGMGAFGNAMKKLESLELIDVLKEYADSGKPLMGICLGMQILMTYGTEFGHHDGLGLIKGHVIRFENPMDGDRHLKVPQICWNKVQKPDPFAECWEGTVLQNLKDGVFMYFNHSYHVVPDSSSNVIATSTYCDCEFCSAVQKENLIGLQFHPERSGKDGLEVYRNFIGIIEQYN